MSKPRLVLAVGTLLLIAASVALLCVSANRDRYPNTHSPKHEAALQPSASPYSENIVTTPFVEPAGSTAGILCLEFRSGARCVPNVDILILREDHPRTKSPHKSDERGNVNLSLCPGRYRWKLLSHHHAVMNPPHEWQKKYEPIVHANGAVGWKVEGEEAPMWLSGIINVQAGKETNIPVVVFMGASIRGTLPNANGLVLLTGNHNVDLYRKTVLRHPQGSDHDITKYNEVGETVVGEDGAFAFMDIEPGTYMVRAWWRTEDLNYYFAQREFVVAPGESKHLGVLMPSIGTSARLNTRLTQNGGIVDDSVTTAIRDDLPAITVVLQPKTPLPAEQDICVTFLVPMCVSATLHGLEPVEWLARALNPPTITVQGMSTFKAPPKAAEFTPPRGGSLDYEASARIPTSQVEIVLRSETKTRIYIHILDKSGKEIAFQHRYPSRWDNDRVSITANVPAGQYIVLAHTQRYADASETADHLNLCAMATMVVSGGRLTQEMHLRPGMSISGIVSRNSGEVLSDRIINFRPVGWNSWPFTACTNAEGRFSMQGLPEGLELEGMLIKERLTTTTSSTGWRLTYLGRL